MDYRDTGGLRFGDSYWYACNATFPFAHLTASTDNLHIELSAAFFEKLFGLKTNFDFRKEDILSIKKRTGILPFIRTGILIEHKKLNYPKFILFWTFQYSELKAKLTALGYTVLDK